MTQEIPQFAGGWSYTQREMTELFKHITYPEKYSILEFGSGASTILLYNHFIKYVKELLFVTYESNMNYSISDNPGIIYVYYNENNIPSVPITSGTYDLILIDGPNGDKRSLWYQKIRPNVKEGTILLVDDFNHYACFGEELDRNFHYEILSYHDEPFVAYGEHSWKIVRILSLKAL
uniref:Methyltransferase n=1 Tax=viral metagenome TaxID=1070528 RepID=A0A6C0KPD1_9ZZZZ